MHHWKFLPDKFCSLKLEALTVERMIAILFMIKVRFSECLNDSTTFYYMLMGIKSAIQ